MPDTRVTQEDVIGGSSKSAGGILLILIVAATVTAGDRLIVDGGLSSDLQHTARYVYQPMGANGLVS